MDKNELQKKVNAIVDAGNALVEYVKKSVSVDDATPGEATTERVLPEGKRLVTTKQSGDRKYQLDEVTKVRQWVANPAVLEALGWKMEDAVEVEEDELARYQAGPALYRVGNE